MRLSDDALEQSGTIPCLRLLGRFELCAGGRIVDLAISAQRLVAVLALHDGALSRARIAGMLWPDKTVARATANLRATLSRLPPACAGILTVSRNNVGLAGQVTVDYRLALAAAARLLNPDLVLQDAELLGAMHVNLSEDLLPDWGEEWLQPKREHFHQLRLRALEALSRRLAEAGQFGLAVVAAQSAVHTDPLRESAREALIHAYLKERNYSSALFEYKSYGYLLHEVLGVGPSDRLGDLLRSHSVADGS